MIFDPNDLETDWSLVPLTGATFVGPGVNHSWRTTVVLRETFDVVVGEVYTLTLYSPYGSATAFSDTDAPPAQAQLGRVGFVLTYETDMEACANCGENAGGALGCYADLPLASNRAESGQGYVRAYVNSWCEGTPIQVFPDGTDTVAWSDSTKFYGRLYWTLPYGYGSIHGEGGCTNTQGCSSEDHTCPNAISWALDQGPEPTAEELLQANDPACISLRTPASGDESFSEPAAPAKGFVDAPCGTGVALPTWWTTAPNQGSTSLLEDDCNGVWGAKARAFFFPGLEVAKVRITNYEDLTEGTDGRKCDLEIHTNEPRHPNRAFYAMDCYLASRYPVTEA